MTLLCNIINQCEPADAKLVLGDGYKLLRRDITSAQKFVLDASLAEVADRIDVKEIERVLDQCRVPFETTWIECLHRDRPLFWSAPEIESMGPAKPKRVGILVKTVDNNPLRFLSTLVWCFGDNDVQTSLISVASDLSNDQVSLESMKDMRRSFGGTIMAAGSGKEIENRSTALPSPYAMEFFKKLMRVPKIDLSEAMNDVMTQAYHDWASEPLFWWSVFALLNCRNVAQSEQANVSKINKARKKRGMPLMAEHTILRLRLPMPISTNGGGSSGALQQEMRGHFVRGHFKIRRSGMFWWSNFYRGDPTRPLSKTYVVEHA